MNTRDYMQSKEAFKAVSASITPSTKSQACLREAAVMGAAGAVAGAGLGAANCPSTGYAACVAGTTLAGAQGAVRSSYSACMRDSGGGGGEKGCIIS